MTKKQCVEKLRAIFPDFEHDQLDAMVRLIGEIRDGFDIEPEEPLPERLYLTSSQAAKITSPHSGKGDRVFTIREVGNADCGIEMERRIVAEAVRRYNAWPKLRQQAEKWYCQGFAKSELLAILDGRSE